MLWGLGKVSQKSIESRSVVQRLTICKWITDYICQGEKITFSNCSSLRFLFDILLKRCITKVPKFGPVYEDVEALYLIV